MNIETVKSEKGITLSALVVTVLVTLILAGIVIADAVNPDTGILTKSTETQEELNQVTKTVESVQKDVITDIKENR